MILEHAGITVSDLERSISFYTRVFGFEILRKTTKNVYLHRENELLELMQSFSPTEVQKPQTPEAWDAYMFGQVGVVHLGFRVDDMDMALQEIVEQGGILARPPIDYTMEIKYVAEPTDDKLRRAAKPVGKPYWRIALISDPDGTILEILER